MRNTLSVLLSLTLLLTACLPPQQQAAKSVPWDEAIFYEIFVRSFYDSDGDGIGDFNGIVQKLDYLNDGDPQTGNDLGITGLWLMPVFASPSYHGYDVTDYFAVNPHYGTLEDFKALLQAAHRRGMRVIVDLPLNHTSDQHPWFRASVEGDSRYRDYYIWSDTDPGYTGPWGEDVWHPRNGKYYYGVFYYGMPDLNYANPAVTAEAHKIAAFWLEDVGVDGFRVDGAKHWIEAGRVQENTPQTLAWFQDFRRFYQDLDTDAITIGEVWSDSVDAAPYVKEGAFDLVFNFPLAEDMLSAVVLERASRFSSSLAYQSQEYPQNRYAAFLSNHDQTRSMTRLGRDLLRAKAAASLLLTSPGAPFIYYGEEIGMTGDKPDPNLRTPMQWASGPDADFTTGTPWMAPNTDRTQVNVAAALADPQSLLHHYQALIRLRQRHSILRTGQLVPVQTEFSQLFASLRVAEKECALVLVNFSAGPVSQTRLSWGKTGLRGTYQPTLLMGAGEPASLVITGSGAVAGFVPLPQIPAGGTVVIEYRR